MAGELATWRCYSPAGLFSCLACLYREAVIFHSPGSTPGTAASSGRRRTLGYRVHSPPNAKGVSQIEMSYAAVACSALYPSRVLDETSRTVSPRRPIAWQFARLFGRRCRNLDSPSLIVGGVEDHVHILCRLSKTGSVADLIRELKRESSKWVKDAHPRLNDVSMAERLRRVLRQPVSCSCAHALHLQSSGTSSGRIIPGRIPSALPEIWP